MNGQQPNLRTARKFPRYRCNQRLCIRYRLSNADQITFGRCMTVSKGGLGAIIEANLEIGQVVHLELAIAAHPAARALKAQVKNRNRSNYGFQFIEPDPRSVFILLPLFDPKELQAPATGQTAR